MPLLVKRTRIAGGIVLILSLFATMFAAPAATQGGNSSIEVHSRICPTDYQGGNHFDDCHGNSVGAGYAFTFTNEDTGEVYERSTNEEGSVGFGNLPAGSYTIVGGPPGDVTETFVYCAVGTDAEPNQEQVPIEYVAGGIALELAADTNVICDWYSIPIDGAADPTAETEPTATVPPDTGNSSIEVHNRICPQDYEGSNWFEDCHSNVADPGLPFTLNNGVTRDGTTNENGNVGFANLPAGTYTITGGAPGDFTDYFVYCSPEAAQGEVPVTYVTGGIQVELAASTNLVCDWYTIPLSQNGETPAPTEPAAGDSSIEVHHRVCPTGYEGDEWFQDCHGNAADPGLSFTFADGVTREGTTNENGNVGFANLPAGSYTITGGVPGEFADYLAYCSTESTNEEVPLDYVTGGIQLDLPANTNLVCDWYAIPYNLQGDPTATQSSENQFDLPIYKLLCESAPAEQAQADFIQLGEVPAGCEQFAGTTVTVADGAGTELGSCVTEEDGACFVTVSVGSTVYGTEDLTTVPEGYAPLDGETIELTIEPATEASLLFVNVASQEPENFDLPIYTLLCEDAPAQGSLMDFTQLGETPAGCEQYEGASVTVTNAADETLGNCVTESDDPCYVSVTVGTTIFGSIDTSMLPAEYAVPENGQTRELAIEPATEASLLFVAVQQEAPATEAPTATVAPPEPTATTEPLPEDRPALIAQGSCDDVGSVMVALPDLREPEGESAGQQDAITTETATSAIPLSLDELFAADHVLVVYADSDINAEGEPVACAPVGGVINASGELVIGLEEQNDSDHTGIVYMAPVDSDGSQTSVSIFLAEGLAEDDIPATPEI